MKSIKTGSQDTYKIKKRSPPLIKKLNKCAFIKLFVYMITFIINICVLLVCFLLRQF